MTPREMVERDKLSDKGRVRRLIEKVQRVLRESPQERRRLLSEEWVERFEAVKLNISSDEESRSSNKTSPSIH